MKIEMGALLVEVPYSGSIRIHLDTHTAADHPFAGLPSEAGLAAGEQAAHSVGTDFERLGEEN